MNQPSQTQRIFVRSLIANALNKAEGSLQLSLVGGAGGTVEIRLQVDSESPAVGCDDPQQHRSRHLSRDEMEDLILNHLAQPEGKLWIEEGDQTVQIRLRGDRVIRETLEKKPQVLTDPLWSVGKATHLDPNQAAPLLTAIGLMTRQGEIKAPMRRKFKQVNHYLDLMVPLLRNAGKGGTFQIVDCGCGKSYLGFVLFWYLRKVLQQKGAFLGIDVSAHLLERSREQAQAMGLPEMQFQCSRILEAALPRKIDLLVSLHACDTATDEAIAVGVHRQARQLVVVPCCQHEIADQLEGVPHYPLRKHGIFTHRFGDLLTDMLRALFLEAQGYNVTAGEFISAEETPKNLMLRATRGHSQQEQRRREYAALKEFYRVQPSLDLFLQELEIRETYP